MKKLRFSILFALIGLSAMAQNKPNTAAVKPTPSLTPFRFSPENNLPSLKLNVVKSYEFNVPVKTEAEVAYAKNVVVQSNLNITYTDGLGRVRQTFTRRPTPNSKDLVEAYHYGLDGLPAESPLPIPMANINGDYVKDIETALRNAYDQLGYTGEDFLYTKTHSELSPLKRELSTFAPGNTWQGAGKGVSKQMEFLANPLLPRFGISAAGLPVANGLYDTLMLISLLDEQNGNGAAIQKQYYNDLGQLVFDIIEGGAQKLITAYVYDVYGRLVYRVTPKAYDTFMATGSLSTAVLDELCFTTRYDEESRPIALRKPGCGWQLNVLDIQGRAVLTQDAVQATAGDWTFYKYDAFGQLAQSGVWHTAAMGSISQAQLQAWVNQNPAPNAFIHYLVNVSVQTYANYQTFAGAEVLLTHIYGEYVAIPNLPFSTNIAQRTEGYKTNLAHNIRGMQTGSLAATSDNSGLVQYAYYYNELGELIQTVIRGTNQKIRFNASGYDFKGELVKSIERQGTIETNTKFAKDGWGRPVKTEHKLNNASYYRVVGRYYYDDLSRLSTRKLGGMGYNLNYEYNIRNWITGINKNYALQKNASDFFGMQIFYEHGFDKTYLNGKIAGIIWRSKGTSDEMRSYGYEYDFAGRLLLGDYYQVSDNQPGQWLKTQKDFTESNLSYDANGNILSMKHMGLDQAKNIVVIDDLSYVYAPNSNKLLGVSESAASQSKNPSVKDGLGDFRDVGTSGSTDYGYDANGNVKSDANRGISNINNTWFGLNKPVLIEFANNHQVKYVYDATGALQSKVVMQSNPTLSTRYDYVGSITYKDGKLETVSHAEGRIRIEAGSNTYTYDYYVKDYLDNVRCIISEQQVDTWSAATPPDAVVWPGSTTGGGIEDGGVVVDANGNVTGSNPAPILYLATSEMPYDSLEELFFDHLDDTRGNKILSADSTDIKVAKLNAAEGKVLGPGLLLKVMAGDQIELSLEALFLSSNATPTQLPIGQLASGILSTLTGAGGVLDAAGLSPLSGHVSATSLLSVLQQQQANAADTTLPKGFLNYLFFDEEMRLKPEQSEALQVAISNQWEDLIIPKFSIQENGYVYIFSSNLSSQTVRTDNLKVVHYQGQLLEEFHYYPYGLTFEVSKAVSLGQGSKQRYNEQFIEREEFVDANGDAYGLEWYDFAFRSYDVQIGRWMQPDPMMQHASPYLAMGDNPVSLVDPLGLEDGGPDDPPVNGSIRIDANGRAFKFIINPEETSSTGNWFEISEEDEYFYDWSLFDNLNNPLDRAWVMADLVYANGGKYRQIGAAYNQQYYENNNRNTSLAAQNSGYNSKLVGKGSEAIGSRGVSDKDIYLGLAGVVVSGMELSYLNDAKQVLKYGQRVKGVVRSAETLTRVNRMVSVSSARNFSRLGVGLTVLGGIATIYDAHDKGKWQNHHTADLLINGGLYLVAGGFPVVGWIAGGAYLVTDITTQYYTGKSITQNLFDR